MNIKRKHFIRFAVVFLLIFGSVYFYQAGIRTRLILWHVNLVIAEGSMGWPKPVNRAIERLKDNYSNKRKLANVLLSQRNGTLVAEGMVIVVEEEFPDGEEILTRYLDDERWNYFVVYNSTFARVCLLEWKTRTGKQLTPDEKEYYTDWQNFCR